MFTLIDQVAPLHRNVSQMDMGDMAAFLCSDEAKNLTGNILYLDSGFHLMGLGTM
jgi:enoyl-[acyl-carrier protein] reductase I